MVHISKNPPKYFIDAYIQSDTFIIKIHNMYLMSKTIIIIY